MIELLEIIGVAVLIGIGYLIILRNYDIYDKEPFSILLASFVVGGVVSIVVTTLLYQFVSVERTFAQAFYKVGLIEELAKLITFFLIYKIIKKHFDEIVDGVIYMSCIALGFAVIENVSYALNSETPFNLLALRVFTSTIGHMAFSGIMGVALYVHLKVHTNWMGIGLSLIIAAFSHGFYDGVLFVPDFNWSFIAVYAMIVAEAIMVIRVVLSFSRFRKPFGVLLLTRSTIKRTTLCVNCGNNGENKLLLFWKISAQNCNRCGNIVFSWKSWEQIHRYYRPLSSFKEEVRSYSKATQTYYRFGTDGEHVIDIEQSLVSCKTQSLNTWLVESNQKDKVRYLNKPVIGWLLKGVGLRYMVD